MGGSTWKENGDGTYTQRDRDYYSPAKGWSWLGLYLMGFARPGEVPPFFILRNLQRTGQQDADGHPVYKGDKTVITIQDVIAAMGPRLPDFDHTQKKFNTAIVVMTMPGRKPTKELISAANDIAEHWIVYWSRTTGGRSAVTVSPRQRLECADRADSPREVLSSSCCLPGRKATRTRWPAYRTRRGDPFGSTTTSNDRAGLRMFAFCRAPGSIVSTRARSFQVKCVYVAEPSR